MVREFELPDVGEGVAEGEIVAWMVEAGDAVEEDQPVAEVETDKAVVDVPSPVNGSVEEIRAAEGEMVPVGNVIITFAVEGEDEADETSQAEPAETRTDIATEAAPDADGAVDKGGQADAETGQDGEASTADGRVFAAPIARRLAREQGIDIAAVEGSGPGGRVGEHDVRAAAEGGAGEAGGTASGDGTGGEEATSAVSDVSDGGDTSESGGTATGEASAVQTSPPSTADAADRDRTLAAPATRRLAEEAGVDIDHVPTDEERDGEAFVAPGAVEAYAAAQQEAQAADTAAVAAGEAAAGAQEERIPYRGVRRTIGQQMANSKFTAPHVTHHDEVDITELVETRGELKEVAAERGISLSYMPFVMKACVAALREFPMVNAMLDEESEEIVQKKYYNVGVATATDAGLMVPVVDDAGDKTLLGLASEMNELVEKARERSIAREEMQGGTFTITNVGAIGGEYATPIVNHPEVAILALGAIKEKPRVIDGEVIPRHVMTVSLSFDHRVLDGAIAAQFTNKVEEYLEHPNRLLLE